MDRSPSGYPRAVAGRSKAPIAVAVVVVVGVLVGAPAGAWLARGAIATSMARGQLEARGLTCDSRLSVAPNATLSRATVGPVRCTRASGVVEAIELLSDFTVELDGTEPAAVRGDSLRLVLRPANVRGGEGWASALSRVRLEQEMAAVLKSLSELASMDVPDTRIARVEVVRGGTSLGHAEQLALTPRAEGLGLSLASARFAAGPMGVGQLALTEVTGEAAAATVTVRGRASARAGVAVIFTVERQGPFTVEARGLDGASPSFRLSGEL